MIHQLKTEERFYKEVVRKAKTFEARNNDRNFQPGDFLALNCIGSNGKENGRCAICEVTYVLTDPKYCVPGMAILGIKEPRVLR